MTGKRRRPNAWQQWKIDRAKAKPASDTDVWHDRTQQLPPVPAGGGAPRSGRNADGPGRASRPGRNADDRRPGRAADDTEVLAPVRASDDTEVLSRVPLPVQRDDETAGGPPGRDPRRNGTRPSSHEAADEVAARGSTAADGVAAAEAFRAEEGTGAGERAAATDRSRSRRDERAGRDRPAPVREEEPVPRPLYARALFLRNIDPGPVLCFFFFEGAIAAGATLALAGLVPWWALVVLPATVAVAVKLNDVVGGSARRRASRLAGVPMSAGAVPRGPVLAGDPVKEAHLEWRRGLGSETSPPPRERSTVPGGRSGVARERTTVPRERPSVRSPGQDGLPLRSRETRDVYPYDGRSRELPRDW